MKRRLPDLIVFIVVASLSLITGYALCRLSVNCQQQLIFGLSLAAETSLAAGLLYISFFGMPKIKWRLSECYFIILFFSSGSAACAVLHPEGLRFFPFLANALVYGAIGSILSLVVFIVFCSLMHPFLHIGMTIGKNVFAYILFMTTFFCMPALKLRISYDYSPFFVLLWAACSMVPMLIVIIIGECLHKKKLRQQRAC